MPRNAHYLPGPWVGTYILQIRNVKTFLIFIRLHVSISFRWGLELGDTKCDVYHKQRESHIVHFWTWLGQKEGGRKEAQLIGQSTDRLTIQRFSLRVPTRPPGWIVSRLFPVKILSAMLVSSQLYHLLPDGIPKNHFFRLLGPTSLYT